MSIMCCLYVPEGIVMAADSRLTRTKPTKTVSLPKKDGEQEKIVYVETTYTLSDNAQKVLHIKKSKTGVSFCGDAMINGVTVADFIRQFEIDKVDEADTTEDVANKLADYYPGGNTHFFVCGYNEDEPYVFDIYNKKVSRSNISPIITVSVSTNDKAANEEYQSDADIPENMKSEQESVKCEIVEGEKPEEEKQKPEGDKNNEKSVIQYGAIWAGQKTAITKDEIFWKQNKIFNPK